MNWCFLLSNFSFNHFFQLFSLFVCWLFFSCLLFLVFNSIYLTRTSFKGLHNIGVTYKSLKVSHKRNLTFKCKWVNKEYLEICSTFVFFFSHDKNPASRDNFWLHHQHTCSQRCEINRAGIEYIGVME